MKKEREEMTNLELFNDIIEQATELEEVDDITDAILASSDIKDVQLRLIVINTLAHRIIELSKCSTRIWLDANELRKREKRSGQDPKQEASEKTPEQELVELEEDTEDDLPFC